MPAQRSSKPAAKPAARKAAAKSAPKKSPARAKPASKPSAKPKAPARRKVPEHERRVAEAEHDHQDPRAVQAVIQGRSGHDKAQHSGIPPAPRNNRIVNWFRRGQGR